MFYDSLYADQIKFNGTFINHSDTALPAGDYNSQLIFEKISASVEGLPLNGSLTVNNLTDPQLLVSVTSSFNLKDEQDLVNQTKIELKTGHLNFHLNYDGPADSMFDKNSHKLYGKINGALSITDGEMIYVPRKLRFSKLNTSCAFNQSDFVVQSLTYNLNGSNINSKGFVDEFIPFLLIPDAGTFAHLEVNCETLYLDNLIQHPDQSKVVKKPQKKGKGSIAKIVDDLITLLNVKVRLHAGKVNYQKFTGLNANGLVTIESNRIQLKDFSIDNSGGKYLLDVSLSDNNTAKPLLTVDAEIKNAEVNEMFASCNNFGQEKVTHKNLRGVINTNIKYRCMLDVNLKLLPETMIGDLDVSIKKGQLNNFDVLGDITKFVFSGRDFDSITFQEIKGRFVLKGYDIQFDRVDIASSVLSMRVDGLYSFKNNTDMSIQIPLKNLKKKKDDYQMTIEDLQKYTGANIYLRARTKEDGKLHIAYDPLKKFRKEK